MKVVVNGFVAVNPSIVRVTVYTYDGTINLDDLENSDDINYKYYELAIPIAEFTDNDGNGNIGINGDKFQEVVSERIVAAQNAANLATYMDTLNLEWDLVINQPVSEETEDNKGMTLAYGGETEANELTST